MGEGPLDAGKRNQKSLDGPTPFPSHSMRTGREDMIFSLTLTSVGRNCLSTFTVETVLKVFPLRSWYLIYVLVKRGCFHSPHFAPLPPSKQVKSTHFQRLLIYDQIASQHLHTSAFELSTSLVRNWAGVCKPIHETPSNLPLDALSSPTPPSRLISFLLTP